MTQAELDSNGGGDGDIDNTATADSNETGPDTDDATVSEFDVEQYFTLTKADVSALCERFRAHRRVPAAILLLHLRSGSELRPGLT